MSTIITTSRLLIRSPEIADFEAIWKMKNDPVVVEYTGGVSTLTREDAFKQHSQRCKNFENNDDKVFSVALKKSNQFIGYCGLKYCKTLNGTEILYGFSKEHWGQGYAKESAKAVLEFGLNNIAAEIVAAVHPSNIGSEKVLKNIGMKYVGKIEWPQQGFVNKYKAHI